MRIGVMGAGSIGCYVGGRLAAAGNDVVLVGRASLAEAIARGGLRMTGGERGDAQVSSSRIVVDTEPSALASCDVVLVSVKSGDTEATARAMAPHLKRGATVVSLQNGVSNPGVLAAALPGNVVLAAMVPFNVARKGEATFHRGTSGTLLVARGVGREGEPVADALSRAGVAASVHDDLAGVLWGKLVLNLNNSVNALAGIPLREELGMRAYRLVVARCIDEALDVLDRAKVTAVPVMRLPLRYVPRVLRMPTPLFRVIARPMIRIDGEARSSMWEDLERRRPTEVDYLNGEIVRLAAVSGGAAVVNARILSLVRDAEAKGVGSPRLDAAALTRAALGNG